mmetsp:Transcript_65319/g.199919  ORF Transcript_65319/g.199919 Transcript_65319/m.199919 type:complete len:245 (-) Transcript_65319:338-1072(-)
MLGQGEADAQRPVRAGRQAHGQEDGLVLLTNLLGADRELPGGDDALLHGDAAQLRLLERELQHVEDLPPPVGGPAPGALQLARQLAQEHEGVLLELQVQQQFLLLGLGARRHARPEVRQRGELVRRARAAVLALEEPLRGAAQAPVGSCELLDLLVQAARVEKLLQLLVKDLEFVHEGPGVTVLAPAPFDEVVARHHVAWIGAAVELVLQRVLDLLFQLVRDVVAVRYVADARHWHGARELLGV